MTNPTYVLVTPARNEEHFIAETIRSVTAQSILPERWVIVSDGSTDRTDDIVREFADQHKFITLVRRSSADGERSCSSKVQAFNAGYRELHGIAYEYIGNLDADVSFAPDYCERIFDRFHSNQRLGIAGGLIHELIDDEFVAQRISSNSVAGAVQMFRRGCYDQIGGYALRRFGGEDATAEIMARMYGWEVETFAELQVQHHRRVSAGEGPVLRTKLRHGMGHYSLGYHPLFEILRNIYSFSEAPYMVGAALTTIGYFWAMTIGLKRELPDEAVDYLRSEQMARLRALLFRHPTRSPQAV